MRLSLSATLSASQKPSLSGLMKINFHVWHPSVVLYSRLISPGPLAITIAVSASQACTPRKSSVAPSFVASGTAHFVQCTPPSMVLNTVPSVPLAHATVPSTEKIPRNPAVVLDSCICHTAAAGADGCAAAKAATARRGRIRVAFMARSIVACSTTAPPASQVVVGQWRFNLLRIRARLHRQRKNSCEASRSVRARLQSCHKPQN